MVKMKCMLNNLVKKAQRILKRKYQNTNVYVNLWCPDGNRESLGFSIPDELDGFISFVNTFSKSKEYTIELYRVRMDETTLTLISQSKNPEEILKKLVKLS